MYGLASCWIGVAAVWGIACWSLLAAQQASLGEARELLAKGLYQQAIEQLNEVIRLEPQNGDAHLLLGSVLATEGKRRESLDQLLEAVRLEPDSAIAYDRLGVALSHFSEVAAAREAFEKAISLDGNQSDAHLNLAMLLAQAADFAGAGSELDRVIQLNDPSVDAALVHYLRARVYDELFSFESAITQLKLAIKINPRFADAWSELGIAQRATQNDVDALKAFEEAASLNPKDPDSQYRLGAEELSLGKFPEAAAHFRKADTLRPNDRATLYNLQRALRKEGQIQEADHVLARVAGLNKEADKAGENSLAAVQLNNAGVELEKKGDLRAALEKYRAAEDLNPDHAGFRLNHGLALCRLGFWKAGIAEIRDVVKENPENVEAARDLYIAMDHFDSSSKTPSVAGSNAQ